MTTEPDRVGDGLVAVEHEELHEELRAVARAILGRPREGHALGASVLAESGWMGIEVPERLGGAGAHFTETGVVLTELGRAASPAPYLGPGVLGVGILRAVEPGSMRDQLLERLAAGRARLAVVLPTGDPAVDPPLPAFQLRRSRGNRFLLEGSGDFVPDADDSDLLAIAALSSSSEPVLVLVDRHAVGMDVTRQQVLDPTRALARVRAWSVAVDGQAVLRFADADRAVGEVLDRGAAAMACDSLGIIGAMVDETVAYVSAREQFGRPVGSFQAVKHACADLLVALEVSSELVHVATRGVAEGHVDRSVAVSMAASHATEAAIHAAGEAIQLHGGIGYTWEAGLHVYQKRALLNRSLFGSPLAHRRRIARRYA